MRRQRILPAQGQRVLEFHKCRIAGEEPVPTARRVLPLYLVKCTRGERHDQHRGWVRGRSQRYRIEERGLIMGGQRQICAGQRLRQRFCFCGNIIVCDVIIGYSVRHAVGMQAKRPGDRGQI